MAACVLWGVTTVTRSISSRRSSSPRSVYTVVSGKSRLAFAAHPWSRSQSAITSSSGTACIQRVCIHPQLNTGP